MTISARILLVIGLIAPSMAFGQRKQLARVGDRVRVNAPDSGFETIIGGVIAADTNVLTIRGSRPTTLYYVRPDQIVAMDISTRSHTQFVSGMVAGGLNGMLLGIGVSVASANHRDALSTRESGFLPGATIGAAIGAAAGMIVGGAIGLTIRHDEWRSLDIDQSPSPSSVSVSAIPGSRRVGLIWSLRY